MKQQICIKLKPISIQFYSQKDCPLNSRYSVIIQQNNTIYKSGIIKSEQVKYLQLSSLAWMEFMIDKNEGDSYISLVLTNHVEDVALLQSQIDRNSENSSRQFLEYKSMLPVNQLRRIPLNKKKKFNFPLMYEGQIRAEGQFKILITQNRGNSSEDIFRKINFKQNQLRDNNKNTDHKSASNPQQQNKCKIIKAKLSDTSIIITPDLFKKKPQEVVEKNTQEKILLDLDLIKKFEMLNKKFSENDEAPGNTRNQNQSVWEDQQQNQGGQSIVMNKYYNYEVIEQQKEQEQQAQY